MRTWLQQEIGLSAALQDRLLATLLLVGGLWLIQRIILALAYRRAQDPWLRYRWRKSVNYLTLIVFLILIGSFFLLDKFVTIDLDFLFEWWPLLVIAFGA